MVVVVAAVRSAVLGGAVGVGDGELSVGTKGEEPSLVVDGVVVLDAQRQQVVEIRGTAVFPPPDVMDSALRESDLAAGDGAGPVQGP
jgi:hypothetical protein